MKRFLKFTTLSLMVVLLTTGCAMKTEYGFKIDKDKKVAVEILVAQDNELIDAMLDMENSSSSSSTGESKTHTDAERWEYLEGEGSSEGYKDFKAEKYDKDGFKGYTYTLELGDIDSLVSDSTDKTTLSALGKDSKIFTKKGDVYSLNIELGQEEATQMEQYASQVNLDIKMKVTLPYKAKSNNASTVEKTTYIWDLTKDKSIELSFDFNGSSSTTTIIIISAVAAVVVIGCAAFFVISKKKKSEQQQ